MPSVAWNANVGSGGNFDTRGDYRWPQDEIRNTIVLERGDGAVAEAGDDAPLVDQEALPLDHGLRDLGV